MVELNKVYAVYFCDNVSMNLWTSRLPLTPLNQLFQIFIGLSRPNVKLRTFAKIFQVASSRVQDISYDEHIQRQKISKFLKNIVCCASTTRVRQARDHTDLVVIQLAGLDGVECDVLVRSLLQVFAASVLMMD